MYITNNFGTRLENGETDQNNPSLVHFQNLTQDPDFAGECIADYWTLIYIILTLKLLLLLFSFCHTFNL